MNETELSFKKTEKFFKQMTRGLSSFKEEGDITKIDNFQKQKTQLSKTDKDARMNARMDTIERGEEFDETNTPPEELSTLENDLVDAFINRKIDKEILGG